MTISGGGRRGDAKLREDNAPQATNMPPLVGADALPIFDITRTP
ncbi:hypothetical protein Pan216_25060 [Planctomycetes bacterium Pan216]|uniref:Uncharacterized protein n=1 Tax=Kolteria novifilia TaxID=2527975 RepID=A0A518B3U1_9BACT|nr:hypothetical protein Pan216_25060 [Planctomycetes bacterium Pan216]